MGDVINQIRLFDKPLFSWYQLSLPLKKEVPLPSESCFVYILEGENQDLMNSGFIAKKGTVILSLCGKTVGTIISKNSIGFISAIVVHFDRDVLQRVFDNEKPKLWRELDNPLKDDICQQDASTLVSSYFLSVSSFFNHKNALNEDILSVKLKEIVLLLLQSQESTDLNTITRSLFSDRMFSFDEVIEANLYVPLNINRLAAMTNNSLASFKRKFRKAYNDSPANYLRKKKLERGLELLVYSQKSISEICYQCGFENPSSFSRMFKTHYKLSPSEYRLSQKV